MSWFFCACVFSLCIYVFCALSDLWFHQKKKIHFNFLKSFQKNQLIWKTKYRFFQQKTKGKSRYWFEIFSFVFPKTCSISRILFNQISLNLLRKKQYSNHQTPPNFTFYFHCYSNELNIAKHTRKQHSYFFHFHSQDNDKMMIIMCVLKRKNFSFSFSFSSQPRKHTEKWNAERRNSILKISIWIEFFLNLNSVEWKNERKNEISFQMMMMIVWIVSFIIIHIKHSWPDNNNNNKSRVILGDIREKKEWKKWSFF